MRSGSSSSPGPATRRSAPARTSRPGPNSSRSTCGGAGSRRGNASSTTSKRFASRTIAAINGYALGGGLELALACDLRIAADHATFATPEVGIATVPGWGATGRLAAIAGPARAKQLILTGQPIDARTAASWGLVGEIVPAGELADRTRALATQIAEQAPIAVQVAKQLIDGQRPRPAVALEALGGGLTAFSPDAEEGRTAFRERRRPVYGDS